MKLITVNLPELYIASLDQLVGEKVYPSRSEAIRCAVRDLIRDDEFFRAALLRLKEQNRRVSA